MEHHEDREREGAPANTGVDEGKEMPPGSRVGPPGNGERDEDAMRRGEEELDQAGGGH